jgi:hypothetical protein
MEVKQIMKDSDKQHQHNVIAEKETDSLLIHSGNNHAEAKNTQTLIQINRCPDCQDINMVFCADKGAGQFVNLQIPPQAVTNVLEQFRQVVE